MSPASEVLLVAQRELRKGVRSGKGIALLLLSIMGGVATALLFAMADKVKREKLGELPPEAVEGVRHQMTTMLGGGDEALGDALFKAPASLLYASKLTVFLGPLLVALLGFDSISGEVQYRTVRFWTVRSRRASYYAGKVLGLWTLVSATTLLIHVITWGIVVSQGEPFGKVIEWGPRFWLVSLPISLVWCGIAQLVASQFKYPMLSLLAIFGTFFLLWLGFLAGATGNVPAFYYTYPNVYDDWLLHPHLDKLFEGLGICVGSALVYITAGALAFRQRDV